MIKRVLIALVLFAGAATFMNINSAPAQYEAEENGRKEDGAPVEVENKLCPVTLAKIATGDKFTPLETIAQSEKRKGFLTGFTYTYEGKTYRFSSQEAIEEFKKDPKKYLEVWEKKENSYKINILYD